MRTLFLLDHVLWRHHQMTSRALDLITHIWQLFIVPFFKFNYNKMLYNLRCFFFLLHRSSWLVSHRLTNDKADSLWQELPRLCLHELSNPDWMIIIMWLNPKISCANNCTFTLHFCHTPFSCDQHHMITWYYSHA